MENSGFQSSSKIFREKSLILKKVSKGDGGACLTSNDLHKQKIFQPWLYSYKTKARNQGNTVVAPNTVYDL